MRHTLILEQMTSIYEMTGLICPSEEQWRANGEKIYEIALYFDKMSAPVMSSIPDKLEMTDEEFEAFMLQMLTNGMTQFTTPTIPAH